MKPANPRFLTNNGGSSSIKFARFETSAEVLTGLAKAFDDDENESEEARRTEPMASCPNERTTYASRR